MIWAVVAIAVALVVGVVIGFGLRDHLQVLITQDWEGPGSPGGGR